MTEVGHNPAEPVHHSPEDAHKNEATKKSNAWLKKAGNKLKKWVGNGLIFGGSEVATYYGTGLLAVGAIATILTGGAAAAPVIVGAAGALLTGGGAAAEWKAGMKHSSSNAEKGVFWLSKLAQTAGVAALTTLQVLGGPAYVALATGMYLGGIGMGARALAHRK